MTLSVQVFPHEYQRALQEQKEEEEEAERKRTQSEAGVLSPNLDIRNAYDIDNTPAVPGMRHVILPAEAQVPDSDSEDEEKKSPKLKVPPKMPKMPEKQLAPPIKIIDTSQRNGDTRENGDTDGMNGSQDIEDTVADVVMKKKKKETLLDKTRGFVKYKRETKMYRDPAERQEDWEEIFDFKSVRRGLKTQAARCMDCGVPFCHSTSHGCPLGNIIPKFNDLVFHR